jgi:hypothetical protein
LDHKSETRRVAVLGSQIATDLLEKTVGQQIRIRNVSFSDRHYAVEALVFGQQSR